ncbi:GNAT family N-acetyltransferase [Streptomyces lunaelactis]|uniref:GNAT family N-acetyltransferase n=1 Tax=Streptomyces lunaelactis TaxID=1535768 RepID=A0A2R4TC52_9ACTN|nr:bifunctional GNAT family N-acetyltransferase/acetate--CoA ligase family protein [Streptomyces lunaelactis]AVZ76693.1 GNAT family N-acetyltransferase [Streptomyces lunaelactis]NUK86421.1 GNAT family N-acetyltransferase [Streptomyces lunaelactis]
MTQIHSPASNARQVHALLTDGTTVRIRQAGPADHDAVLALYEGMSAENLRRRFFTVSHLSAEQAAGRLTRRDQSGYRALVAESGGRLVGLAEYDAIPESATAEIALTVADDWHHRGLGTLLLEHLVDAARQAGITAFAADALSENHEMLKVFADLGLRTTRHFDGPEVRWTVQLTVDEDYLSAVDNRGSTADVASLKPLLRPRTVAVVGAGRKAGSVGRAVLRNVRTGGFAGRLDAVNPQAEAIEWVSCHHSVAELSFPPDLAVLAVPAAAVPQAAEDCGKLGARALLVVSSCLDAHQAAALLATCRAYGMRLVGPNCLGLANTDPDLRLNATFAADRPLAGTAGVAVQSGGVGIALLDGLSRLGIGVSTFVSLGDKYDVSGNDMLQWWESDGQTDLAVLHLESFGNPRAFSRTARRVARTMPVLTVDAGRSEAGRRAAASHTAAAATRTMTRQALFTQAGIIATRTIGELLDSAALLHSQPLPSGSSVAIVTNAGGAGVLAADACAEAGLRIPELGSELVAELLAGLPAGASATNPVDATAAVTETQLQECVDRLAAHGAVDAVLVVLVPTAVAAATGDDLVRALSPGPDRRRSRTVAAVLPAQAARVELLPTADGGFVPSYSDAADAARALAHAVTYARWRARPEGTIPELADVDTAAAKATADAFLAEHPDGDWLDPRATAELLGHYGIPQIPWEWAEDEEAAVTAAARLAGPDGRVVMKAHWPGLVHKSEQRAVHLDLQNASQVRAAHRDLVTRFGDLMTGVVVQPLAERGIELFAGVVQDEVFGPLVLFGLGGTATELLADHAARLAPLTDHDVHDLITSPRCAPLLFGYRGGGAVDLEGLEQLLLRLSRMACDLPQLAEADLNPVIARPGGITALDIRVRLMPRQARDPYLRRLR